MHLVKPALMRRALLLGGFGLPFSAWPGPPRTPLTGPSTLQFPRDFGSHPAFAIEWWYLTGRLLSAAREFGFQLTFFRSRVPSTQAMTSAFAAKQLIFAHAAVTDVSGQKHRHDQRIAREGFGVAHALPSDTGISLRDWSLVHASGHYSAHAAGQDFGFQLDLTETQPLLLQGEQGLSRKGPKVQQSSFYYSLPQLKVRGDLTLDGRKMAVMGSAWLDHEWSQSLLDPNAVGWDWIGMNLLDGSALTAFQLRDKAGQALWQGGSYRHADAGAAARIFGAGSVDFTPLRHWLSPLTRATYPVEWALKTPAGDFTIEAILDPQELDSRNSTGAVYWEGLSELRDPQGRLLGHGYLEMTGYAAPLRL